MSNTTRAIALAVIAMSCAACKNVAPDADQAAVIVNPDAASRAALQATVNAALHTDVRLADDALTETSILIIERKVPQSIEGSPAQGRNMEMPFQFHLVRNGSECILIDQRDLSRTVLADTVCSVE
jgi:fructose-1,6-bisphosphatase/sedoheptulose 1,7-bisphosphatase-like protein